MPEIGCAWPPRHATLCVPTSGRWASAPPAAHSPARDAQLGSSPGGEFVVSRPPLRAALIGCGHISARHIPAWQATPDAELVAVCDLNRARAEARARQFGIERVYTDVDTMIAAEALDCIDIATHDVTHTALVKQAASHGLHVLCQKPLAPTMAEARAMVAHADE